MPTDRPSVLMISKPIAPPWDDSGKNIVFNQIAHGERYAYRVLTPKGTKLSIPGVHPEPVYTGTGRYSPSLVENMRVLLAGVRPRGSAIFHYFFAPNALTSRAGRVQRTMARVKTVQTVCSVPASFENVKRLLFTDRVIVLSKDTKIRLIAAGVPSDQLSLVYPGIEPLTPPDTEKRAAIREKFGLTGQPLVVFPGDFEFSRAAATVAGAVPEIARTVPEATVVFACRIKREPSRQIRDDLRRELESAGWGNHVRFLDAVDNMPEFIGAADVVILPQENLYAKMDIPLVLLEAMSQGVPLVLADVPPLNELLATKAGLPVQPRNSEALARTVIHLLSDEALRRSVGQAGRKAVDEEFSARRMAAQIEAIYDEVLGR